MGLHGGYAQNITAPKDRVSPVQAEHFMTRNLPPRDAIGDMLLAIGVGFLVNLMLAVALPEIGPFIAGLVAGVMVKAGPLKGGIAGFLAGTLGGLASVGLWVITNLISLPGPLLPLAFQTAVAMLTATYAILSLSGGIIGSVVSLQHWPRIHEFLIRQRITFPFHLHHATPAKIEKKES